MATGFAALALASFVAQLSGFAVLVVLAHRLTPAEIGAYAYALGVVGYFAIPANFGVTGLAIRDLARRRHDAPQIMGEVTALQVAVGIVPYVVLVALAPVLAVDGASRAILPIVGIGFVLEGLSYSWVLYGGSRFAVLAVARVIGAAVFAAGCLLFVQPGRHVVTIFGWVTLGGLAATALVTFVVALREHGRPRLTLRTAALLRRFRGGIPLGISAVMISVYYTIDSVMLGVMRDTATVGQYSIAYKVPLALMALAALWGSVLFPHASRLAERDPDRLRSQLNVFASVACVGSLPVLAGAIVLGGQLMPRLFGPVYAPAGAPFILLTAAAAIVLVTINYGTVAIAIGDERHYAIGVSLAALTNVVVNLALIGPFGMTGAAVATIAAELVAILYVFVRVRGILGRLTLQWSRLARAAGAAAVMVVALVSVGGLAPFGRVVLGAVVFSVAAALLRVVSLGELRPVWSRDAEEVIP